jgi:hypothetical protein
MQARPPLTWLLAGLLMLLATPLHAVTRPLAEPAGEVALPSGSGTRIAEGDRRLALAGGDAWRAFRAAHGDWNAMWNAGTGTPHRAFGPSFALRGFRNDPAGVDEAVRAFVAANEALFGPVDLETAAIRKVGGLWHARYRQTIGGLPVLFADWEFRVSEAGRLMAFGADAHHPREAVRPAILVAPAARIAATAGLAFDPTRDRVEGGRLALLPLAVEDGIDYRTVYEWDVRTETPVGRWSTLVDARDGTVLSRMSRVRYAISGTVTGPVHLLLPTEVPTTSPMAHLTVTVGPIAAQTNVSGFYTASPGVVSPISANLFGLFCNVNRMDGPADAGFAAAAGDPATVDIAWTPANSHDAERDAFYHVNLAHDYSKALDPAFTANDYVMPCAINIANTCNAFWDGTGVNFFQAGGGCPNTATMPDVVYHEYGHGVNDNLYAAAGASFMSNGALHEGMADVNAAFIQDSPLGGKGFFGPGTVLRRLDLGNRWPEDRSGDPHLTGLIIAGAFWDLRQAVGLSVAARLAHFAKYGTPDDPNDGVAMGEYFMETLIADDDDANLGNGTPHDAAIVTAFNLHGIGTGFFMNMTHVPLGDQVGAGGYPVTATIQYAGPIGSLDASSPTLHYQVDSNPYATIAMTPAGGNNFTATIPHQGGAIVRYFLTAEDTFGQETASPGGGASSPNMFLAGATTTVFLHNQETPQGWTVGQAGDNATTGIWTRVNPVGTSVDGQPVQPEDDHTPDGGVLCFITGQQEAGGAGANDVDGGRTTLLSTVFDATVVADPLIEYYRWYTNHLGGAPNSDVWRVDLSNDGGASWTPVENTLASDNSWKRVVIRVADLLPRTALMRVRFTAEDAGEGSLVEAGVDDFRLLEFQGTVAVGDPSGAGAFALGVASPNPFVAATALSYRLVEPSEVTLRVFDVTGRLVRVLDAGSRAAGEHRVEWDGRDLDGHPVASGVYLARLSTGGQERTRTIVRMH